MESLKEKTAKGLFWGGMNNGVQQLLGLIFGIILGRLLNPSDYGLIAMITIFSLIATALQNSGFSTALVNEKEPKDSDYNAVFWFNIFMGGVIYLTLFFSAPLIADYYDEPRLVALCRYAFIGLLFSCSGVAQAAYLYKNLRAQQLAKASITATILSSSVAAVMAWQGFSYWSLATQTNLFILISTLLRWHYSDWRPTLKVDFTFIRKAFPFSVKILISDVLTQVNNNVMNMLLGRYFSAHDTGNYNQAYQWNNKCTSLIQGMVKQVDQTVLVSVRDDRERQLAVLRKMVRFAAPQTGRYLAIQALSTHEGKDVVSVAELYAVNAVGARLSREPWTVKYADSEETKRGNNTAEKSFDLQESTYWRTERGAALPHLMVIDLGSEQTITGFDYLPRMEEGAPGSIKDYKIFVY